MEIGGAFTCSGVGGGKKPIDEGEMRRDGLEIADVIRDRRRFAQGWHDKDFAKGDDELMLTIHGTQVGDRLWSIGGDSINDS